MKSDEGPKINLSQGLKVEDMIQMDSIWILVVGAESPAGGELNNEQLNISNPV